MKPSLAAAILAAAFAAAETRSDAPLRLVEPGAPLTVPQAPSPRRGGTPPAEREWLLQNVSDAPIAAWNHACVPGGRDGRGGWTGSGRDAFGSARAGSGLLQPGEADVVSLPEPPPRESPFEVWSCGVPAVVFADGRTWGSPEVLDRVFGRRVAQAREARRLVGAIERLQPGDGWIGPGDAIFPWLLLWRDADRDGVGQPDELTPAGEAGLEGIDLADRPSTRRTERGDRVGQTTTTRWRAGAERPAWHVVLAVPPAP
ncbi:MAG TPA: hypothetical protein VF100_07585 [Thermoanaerobaculia bacterium]